MSANDIEMLDCVVAGAGVIGLAIARALALAGREVVVLEAAEAIGTGTSSRNSEVVHAGIYYPPGSLKAQLCVAGRDALYQYCASRGVGHARVGKLIVAADAAQTEGLDHLAATAARNGVQLDRLDGPQVLAYEPEVRAVAGLFSPLSGIVDSHALMLALQGDLEAAGGAVVLHTGITGGHVDRAGVAERVVLELGGGQGSIACRTLVIAAGLGAQDIATAIGLDAPPLYLAKGNYFAFGGRPPFRHLVYPMPEPGGLGVHATVDLAGRVRFGPDVEWIERPYYPVDPARGDRFYAAIRRWWPGLPDGALAADYAGIRPKLGPAGSPAADFWIERPLPSVITLFGMESPGLTACLAIGDYVRDVAA